ncbi:hypothetical protein PFAG_03155 [Plasmodium falciparum Santa Lucia]|nr:hypothetical protein PFUGPA_04994 [Plasmodium falciparum Palo Alto/Uganda]EUT84063.1 hypothetical protein PFAG_03155 [Plasmodium falciparum Santa Lucia]
MFLSIQFIILFFALIHIKNIIALKLEIFKGRFGSPNSTSSMFNKDNKIKCRRKEVPLLFVSSNKCLKDLYLLKHSGVSPFEEKGSFIYLKRGERNRKDKNYPFTLFIEYGTSKSANILEKDSNKYEEGNQKYTNVIMEGCKDIIDCTKSEGLQNLMNQKVVENNKMDENIKMD